MDQEQPVLRVGIISDMQTHACEGDWGMSNTVKAFHMLAEMKIDVLVNGGDIADQGDDPAPLYRYQEHFHACFKEKLPAQIACAGNHDFWSHPEAGNRSQAEIYEEFCRIFGYPHTDPVSIRVSGYDFIAFSTDNERDYSPEDCEKLLRPVLEKSATENPGKPIFLVTHYHPKETCIGGYNKWSGKVGLRQVLNDFPQVVSISSHTHRPLEDERCIWQGEFTAVNTSTLSYIGIDERCANQVGGIPPYAREGVQMMVMDIYRDRLVFRRYNVEDRREIKPDRPWIVSLPYSPENPVYSFERRAAVRTAPRFKPGTQLLFRVDYGFIYLLFEGAEHDDFTHFYRVAITEIFPDGSKGETKSYTYISNFYRLERNQDPRQSFRLPPNSMEKGKTYRFDVYPVETFGKEGAPITVTCPTPFNYPFRNMEEIGPQE